MAYLLDTHVWIWSQAAPERLGPSAERLLSDPQESVFLATISSLELARLVALGRVELTGDTREWVAQSLDLLCSSTIELTHAIAIAAYALPGEFHRDPADRILVATAREHHLTLLTADDRILAYPHVQTHDARL